MNNPKPIVQSAVTMVFRNPCRVIRSKITGFPSLTASQTVLELVFKSHTRLSTNAINCPLAIKLVVKVISNKLGGIFLRIHSTMTRNNFRHNRGHFNRPLQMPPFEIWLAVAYACAVLVLYTWRWWYAWMEI